MKREKADFSIRMANHRVSRLVYLLKLLGIATLYALLAKIVLTFFSANGVVSIVWPPSGLALAVLLMGGRRYFPGIFLGAFLANAMTGLALGVAAAIAIGNTLEALLGAWLLTRDGRFDSNLRTLRDYLRLVVLAGFVACSVAALNGSTTLLVSGFITTGAYFQNLLNWWMGDAIGIMLVTPLILAWRRMPNGWLEPKRMTEAVLVLGLTLLVGQIVFLSWFHNTVGQVALGYWMFLFVTWAAARLGIHGVVTILSMTAIQGLLGAVQGVGFFAHDIAKTGLVNYWFYIMALSVVGMALSTHFTERKQIEAALRKSEARFRNILEHAPIGMAVASLDGRLMQVNQALCIILGYEKEELEKLTIRKITHPEDVASSFANIKRLLDGELDYYQLEKRYIRKDGQTVWAQLAASIGKDDSGAPLYFIGQIEDITERKRAEELLRKSSEEIEDLYNHAPCGYHSLDKDGIILRINDTELAWLGYTRDEVIGRMKWTDLITSAGLPTFRENYPRLKKQGFVHDLEFELIRKDGTMFTGVINATAIYDASGNYVMSRSTLFDITKRKQVEDALHRSKENLNRAQAVGQIGSWFLNIPANRLEWSAETYRMFGIPQQEAIDLETFVATIHPEDRDFVLKAWGEAMAGAPYDIEHRIVVDGQARWVRERAQIERDAEGRPLAGIGTVQDITERKQIEELIKINQARFSTIFNQAPSGIALIDSFTGTFYEVNPRYAEIAGRTIEEMTTIDWMSITHPDDVQEDLDNMALLNAGKIPGFRMDKRYIRPDGSIVWINMTIAPLKMEKDISPRHLAMIDDITERKEFEEELKRSNTDLEQFSYAVSHDIRQPLRMISSYLQLIEMGLAGQLDSEKRDYFNFAIDGAKRIDQMLVALLEYSRVGKMGEPPTWIESRAVLDEALQFIQPAIAEAQARLNITGEWPRILVSHDEILRLLQNLIGNAAKYRIAGRIPEITVSSGMVRNEWHLCVADNGVGIIPNQIKRLFQVFQRLQSRAAYEGTGIGLALCRKIAEHHKGRIWAESAGEGLGSKFCVVLPVPWESNYSGR